MDELLRAATEEFIARGYRLTQMSDVALAVGVAKGTLYGYVESKDALLFLCMAHADEPGQIPVPDALPVRSPPAGALERFVKQALEREIDFPRLEAAMRQPDVEDVAAEASGIIGEFFDLMARHRRGIKLLDRCMDHPELNGLWQSQGRADTRLALERYLEHRIASGHFRPVSDVRIAARILIETCTTWAVHIHWDRAPEVYDPDEARAAVIEFAVRGLLS